MAEKKTSSLSKVDSSVLLNHLEFIRSAFSTIGLTQETHLDGERSRKIGQQFGYPVTIPDQEYINFYFRQGIANRVINILPDACWQDDIKITDNEDTENDSEFDIEVSNLIEKLSLIHMLTRVDKLAGLGEYSVLLGPQIITGL